MEQPETPRLTAEMADFRLLVLDFIREYHVRWGGSPSYGEIAARLDSNRTRVRKAVKSLDASGLIIRTPGPRGIALPSARDAALRQLQALGWHVDPDERSLAPLVTDRTLPAMPVLTYSDVEIRNGVDDGGQAGEARDT